LIVYKVCGVSVLVDPCSYKQRLIHTWQLSAIIISHHHCNSLYKEFLSNLVLLGMVGHKGTEESLTFFFFKLRICAELIQILRMFCAGFQTSVVSIVVFTTRQNYLPSLKSLSIRSVSWAFKYLQTS